jgi:hypothetical protein
MTNTFEQAFQESQRSKRGTLMREWLDALDALNDGRADELREALANPRYSAQLISRVLHRWREDDESLPRPPGHKAVSSARPSKMT